LCIVNYRYFKGSYRGANRFFFNHAEQGGDDTDGGMEEEDLFADLPAQFLEIISQQ
jgi:hypothetical protein